MREKLARFMTGRNGADNLCRFAAGTAVVLIVASMFIHGEGGYSLWVLSIVGVAYCYFRIFSRNVYKRRAENEKYLNRRNAFLACFRGARDRFSQRKNFKFFRCPSCHTMLRVPRGKGKIKVVCRKCGTSFIKKT